MAGNRKLIDANKAQAVLVNMAEHLMEAGNPEMAGAVGYAAEVIGKQKTVDAVEVVHGRWDVEVGMSYNKERICPVCNKHIESNYWSYCPNCGAKMDGDGNVANE